MTAEALLEQATARHRAGDLLDGRRLYRQVLSQQPGHAVALFRAGVLELQAGCPAAALSLFDQASALTDDVRHHLGRGEALAALARWADAAMAYQRALQADPHNADTHIALGKAWQALGADDSAIAAYRQALTLRPDSVDALSWLGAMLHERGEVDEAVLLLRSAVRLEPSVAAHATNLGVALCRLRKFAEAVTVLRGVLERAGDDPAVHFNLGNALHGLGQSRAALEHYRRAVALRPAFADALVNLGNVYRALGEPAPAAAAYEAALRVQPDSVAALGNAGALLRVMGRLDEAETLLRRGLELNLQQPALHNNLGNVLKDAGDLAGAIDAFRQAVALAPDDAAAHSNLVYALSFQALDGQPILDEARRWHDRHAAPLQPASPAHAPDRTASRRLRIGYVSPYFRDHCQALFTIPLLTHHDHDAFEIFAYSDGPRHDACTRRLAQSVDHWRDVHTLDDAALSAQIRADRIDILVDLTMHMADGRPLVFARKPAPVQLAWLAYPGTTGIATVDYRLSDPRLDPPGSFEHHYCERTVLLPDSFWCYDPLTDQPAVNPLPALARGYPTLGCLNNPCKLTDHTLRLWTGVLEALPTARLLLLMPFGRARQRLLERLGVQAERVAFVPPRPRAEYLRTYHDIDLGLDTFPYNGHTTSFDALWMGVPVVTRVGQTCVGRAGLSQLYHLDLLELAAATDDAFVNAVVALAHDLPRLATLRSTLRQRLAASPLMDGPRFARSMEAAYRDCWRAAPV